MTIRRERIIKPDGTRVVYEVVKRGDVALMIAKKRDRFCMVRMYRHPVKNRTWEFPMGFIDKNESPVDAAIRELKEETGLVAKKMEKIGSFWPSPGMATQKIHVFYADKSVQGQPSFDGTETDIEIEFFTYLDIQKRIKSGVLQNGATLAALALLVNRKLQL